MAAEGVLAREGSAGKQSRLAGGFGFTVGVYAATCADRPPKGSLRHQ